MSRLVAESEGRHRTVSARTRSFRARSVFLDGRPSISRPPEGAVHLPKVDVLFQVSTWQTRAACPSFHGAVRGFGSAFGSERGRVPCRPMLPPALRQKQKSTKSHSSNPKVVKYLEFVPTFVHQLQQPLISSVRSLRSVRDARSPRPQLLVPRRVGQVPRS